jgi:hypothetical protein
MPPWKKPVVGDRVVMSPMSDTEFVIYATNMVPLIITIPAGWTHGESRLLLNAAVAAYENVRKRLAEGGAS